MFSHLTKGIVAVGLFVAPAVYASDQHVATPADLHTELRSASAAREQNIAVVQRFLSTEAAQKAMDSAHVNADRVRASVPLLSDQELARLSSQAVKAQDDFAAGGLTSMQITLIILGAILIGVVAAIAAA